MQAAAQHLDNRRLHLVLMPTEKCNFRCTYCYEDFQSGNMAPNVVRGVKELLRRRAPKLEFLEIGWFGGEPLLAKSIVIGISDFALDLSRQNPRLEYASHMTTNGYLLDVTTAEALTRSGVTVFHISLDGPMHVHDLSRRRLDGGDTFMQIWSNLQALSSTSIPFRVILRVHFAPGSHAEIPRLIDSLNALCADDSRFAVYFKPIKRLGGPNDQAVEVMDSRSRALAKRSLERGMARPDMLHMPPQPTVCYAAKANSLVVRSNGDLAKCTVALNNKVNSVGRLHEDGTVTVDQDRFRFWIRGLASEDETELGCPYGALSPTVLS